MDKINNVKKRGPKLTNKAKNYLKTLLIAGERNKTVLRKMAEAGFPSDLSLEMLSYYRRKPDVQAAFQAAAILYASVGMGLRGKRIEALVLKADQWLQRATGYTPYGDDGETVLPGPPSILSLEADKEATLVLRVLIADLEKMLCDTTAKITRTDSEGKQERIEVSSSSALPYSEISMDNLVADALQRHIELTRGRSIEDLLTERIESMRASGELTITTG